jgi:hypothetical protein
VDTGEVPFPPSNGRRRRCALCGIPELTEVAGVGRFLLVADKNGRGPVCPTGRGCSDRQKQMTLLPEPTG